MRIVIIAFILCSTSFLSACSMSGNVVPKSGPTMEQVYDSMPQKKYRTPRPVCSEVTQEIPRANVEEKAVTVAKVTSTSTFRKLPNPELTMYVFPHFAGNDAVPIPGYATVFNAYTQDHYALPNEIVRG